MSINLIGKLVSAARRPLAAQPGWWGSSDNEVVGFPGNAVVGTTLFL